MNWKRWKRGLLIATVTGLVTALTVGVIVPTMTWKEACLVLVGSIAKDVLLYLKQHPVESVEETTMITKP